MLKYPVGVQSFETLRTEGFVYVDKTDLVYELAKGHAYFLSRPRRFGKSLLVSTLHAYFEGRKELFEGLKIMELEKEWKKHVVLLFSFGSGKWMDKGLLENALDFRLGKLEKEYNVDNVGLRSLGMRFVNILAAIRRQTGQKVVVLVDEYDKPLLDVIDNNE